jgi:filamentous hemagglutinin family protein
VKKSQSATFFGRFRRARGLRALVAVLLSFGIASTGLQAQTPVGGTVRTGDARISGDGTSSTQIEQFSDRAVIDWRSFSIGAGNQVVFLQPSDRAATLNRVTGEQVSLILGKLDANGRVLLINPNGIVFGGGAQVNVGSLIATTSNISDANFMAGRLVFDGPGRVGAGVYNAGAITAREGGLVALVAPHVRNDGLIAARLGRVALGAADTFTVDLYGDALISLALSDANAGHLRTLDGKPVTSLVSNAGRIETDGGQTVLMTARGAKHVLDDLINMSGTIKADTVVEQNGRILLTAEGGKVDVTGTLVAQGKSGGTIEVLGEQVRLGGSSILDASGTSGGGTVHVGGAFQGSGDTYRSSETIVDAGAALRANAAGQGNGGEVVVWSDGHTRFEGAVEARGGTTGGDGGRMEVSGKGTLDFLGQADASAANGRAGSLLLDPAFMNVGAAEASTVTRVLRTGTSATIQADVDINVNSAIFGGDREEGGGLTMTAGRDINVNDFIVTNNGAIDMTATQGTVNVAPGIAVFAGSAPITVSAAGSLRTAPMLTNGALSLQSLNGSVAIDSFIDDHTGPVNIRAAGNVDINQPIVNTSNGSGLTVAAGQDVNVNAQVDGRGGAAGGAVTMTASRDVNVNEAVVTNAGAVTLTASNGAVNVDPGAPIVAGSGALTIAARGDISTGAINAGALTIDSAAGSVGVNGVIDSATGETRIHAGADVSLNQAVLNGQSGSALSVNAGRNISVNAAIDGRGGVPGGAVSLTAARNLDVNDYIATGNGAIDLTAGDAITVAAGKGTFSGNAAIAMRSGGDLTLGAVSGGSLSASSARGTVRVNGVIDGATGRVDLAAARDVAINQAVLNTRTGSAFNATAGGAVIVNAPIDGRGGAVGGAVALTAGRDVAVNSSIATNNGSIDITATDGAATMASGTVLVSGSQAITIDAADDVTTRGISGGSLSASSRGGSVLVEGVIDGATGRVDLAAARDVNINAPVLNLRTGAPLSASAGQDVNVNAPIDGTTGKAGGAVSLTANRNVNINTPIATHDGAIRLSAVSGAATVAGAAGLFAGSAPIAVDALGNISTGTLSGGAMNVTSRGGSVAVTGRIAGNGGAIAIGAAGQVDINHAVTNPGISSPLAITAGTDVNVNAAVGQSAPGSASSPVTLTAGRNVNLNESIVTGNAAIAVTATNGSVNAVLGEGLFAGSGDVAIQSGQTLTTPDVGTTGNITFRSTAGTVNVDKPIDAGGAITIGAFGDINVNQGIANANPRSSVTLTAGRDINLSAKIDGRDPALTGPSGSVTLQAGNDIALDEDIVAVDAPVTLAAGGTVNWAPTKALFAGEGAISVTAGSDLNTGATSTTGALTFTSTQGDVNVNAAISDTTGRVTIAAGDTVNVNQPITNLKSGADLTVNAGVDINVHAHPDAEPPCACPGAQGLAMLDGRGGAAAGGAVTLTAGNNIDLAGSIATNDGLVTLTATRGSVTLPVGLELVQTDGFINQIVIPMEASVTAGSADVTITSGGDFTLSSPVKTTGALTITSTGGDIITAAPIDNQTGAVTLTAGDALVANREIRTNNAPITLNAGAGGITINTINDFDYSQTSSVNSGTANLTLNSVGNVAILDQFGVSSASTVTIDTQGQILQGSVGNATDSDTRPQLVRLDADGGIVSFNTGRVDQVVATSSGGSINLAVDRPQGVQITTGTPGTTDCPACDITLNGFGVGNFIGDQVTLNAGGSVHLSALRSQDLNATARSGDINFTDFAVVGNSLTGLAGRDIVMNDLMWLDGLATLSAGRDITAGSGVPIHVSFSRPLTLTAGRNLTLSVVETLGAVNLAAQAGNITLNNDLGPHIVNNTMPMLPDFNPADLGIASLNLSAGGSIAMQGARAEGDIAITAGGNLSAAKEITSVGGTVTLNVGGTTALNQAVPIGTQEQLDFPFFVAPGVPPGPRPPLPTPPGFIGNGGPGMPAFAEIPVSIADQNVPGVGAPGAATGSVGLAGGAAGAAAPGRQAALTGRPGTPSGSGPGPISGSSDPGGTDTAAALRAAGEACGQASTDDTGLDAVEQKKQPDASGEKNASCAGVTVQQTAGTTGQPGTGTTGKPTTGGPAGSQPAKPAAPTGGGFPQ